MVVASLASLDIYSLVVDYIFGSFWMGVIGIGLLLFIIGGVLGRISIWTITWYCVMFILAMTIGYGYITINILITLMLLLGVIYCAKSYFTKE